MTPQASDSMKHILEINKRSKAKAIVKIKTIQKLDKLSQQIEKPKKVLYQDHGYARYSRSGL